MAVGRPTDYNEQTVAKCYEYLEGRQDTSEDIVTGQSEKGFTTYKQKVTVKLPTIEGLAVYIGVHKDTVFEWDKIHPEFSDFLNILRGQQAERLIDNGLSGDYNPIIAKMLLSKHGYTEKTQVEHSGDQESPIIFKKADGRAVKP